MIGVYDYTVILTYLSCAIAGCGMMLAINGYYEIASILLLFCGIIDMLDGPVARTKKNRTAFQRGFGIQIDSFCDLISFGIFPAVIGYSLSPELSFEKIILILFPLFGLIRLAFYNVQEQERQAETTEKRKYYVGFPITSSAVIFPILALFRAWISTDAISAKTFYLIYIIMMAVLMILYVTRIKIPKPGKRGIGLFILAGVLGLILYILRITGILPCII